ncbi:hypothetical protein THARTR1_09549 [Trichoderma harzianum]|uniref:T6SS Phospholipase effector Tle1-like catalytic domain-containing protein n=1 Tax=Trichoderma harzianum TaxID=5544 RepID=A0A2K0TWB1_TRIHA|nr:hypothetical protein THARTR1_09549 [Trichoderma harzianum]
MSLHGSDDSEVTNRPAWSERPVTPLSPKSSSSYGSPKDSGEFGSPATSVSSVGSTIPLPAKPQYSQENKAKKSQEDLKLILFFDGTGNSFSGSSADTNVVKLLKKLDRKQPNQYHYYQSRFSFVLTIHRY